MKINFQPIRFDYLLLEYYKSLNISDEEAITLLMIEHLLEKEPTLITAPNLEIKMNFDEDKVDAIINNLYVKGFIDIIDIGGKMATSLNNLKTKLLEKFIESTKEDEKISADEVLEESRREVLKALTKLFERPLTVIEEENVNNWIKSGTDKTIILESIKDAKQLGRADFNLLDRLILKRMREQDNYGNEIKKF